MFGVRCMKASTFTRHGIFERRIDGQQLHRDLRQALGPARLLHLEAVGFDRQLRRALDARDINEFPALQLRAIAEIGIFGQRVVLPSAGIVDHRLARRIPAVPLKLKNSPPPQRATCSSTKWPSSSIASTSVRTL